MTVSPENFQYPAAGCALQPISAGFPGRKKEKQCISSPLNADVTVLSDNFFPEKENWLLGIYQHSPAVACCGSAAVPPQGASVYSLGTRGLEA